MKNIWYLVSVSLVFFFLSSVLTRNNGILSKRNLPDILGVISRQRKPSENKFYLDSIFSYKDPNKETKSKSEFSIMVTGDIIPARSVNAKVLGLHDFNYPYEKTVSLLRQGDLVFVNLESPLIANCPTTLEGMIFCGDERNVQGLNYAGVTVANLANNHLGNYGPSGVVVTANLLVKNNIAVTGNGKPAIVNVKNKQFGFLGYNDIGGGNVRTADNIEQIGNDIKVLKKNVDFVVVAFHWGTEYTSNPTPRQIELAHNAIDAGADLIIGNHPHWVQGVEQYKGKFITYAHGNFIFDQMWSRETREGVVGKYVFDSNGLTGVSFYPVIIEDYAQPRFAAKEEALVILERMKESSKKLLQQ